MSNCIGCDYYDDSVDCCNCDDYCYMDGIAKGIEEGKKDLNPLIKEIHDCVYNEGYLKGRAEVIDNLIELVNSDGFKMRCIRTNLPFFEFVANEFEQVLKEQK